VPVWPMVHSAAWDRAVVERAIVLPPRPTRPSPHWIAPGVTPGSAWARLQLKYVLIDAFGRPFFCDPLLPGGGAMSSRRL
jgi:hypothetical protein